jgi:hypothetical protein
MSHYSRHTHVTKEICKKNKRSYIVANNARKRAWSLVIQYFSFCCFDLHVWRHPETEQNYIKHQFLQPAIVIQTYPTERVYSRQSRPDAHATSAPPSSLSLISLSVRHCRSCPQLQAVSPATVQKIIQFHTSSTGEAHRPTNGRVWG